MRNLRVVVFVAICLLHGGFARGERHIYCADHENKRLIKIKEDGTLLWDCPNNNGHDVQLLKNGHVLIVTGDVQEVDSEKNIVWKVGKPTVENAESAQRLDNGHTVIADNGKHAVLELDEHDRRFGALTCPTTIGALSRPCGKCGGSRTETR